MKRLFTFIIAALVFSNISAQHISGEEALEISAYPNPVSSRLHFTTNEKAIGTTVRIINVLGTEVLSYELSTTRDAIDVSRLQSGLYLYSIIDKNDHIVQTGKFNKE